MASAVLCGLVLFCIAVSLINLEPNRIEIQQSLKVEKYAEQQGVIVEESSNINVGNKYCAKDSKQIVNEAKNGSKKIEYVFTEEGENVYKKYAVFSPGVVYTLDEKYHCPSINLFTDALNQYKVIFSEKTNEKTIVYEKELFKTWILAFLFLIVPIVFGIILSTENN